MIDPQNTQDILYQNRLVRFLNDDTYLDFLKSIESQAGIVYASLTFPIDTVDPLACIEILSEDKEFQYFWENPQQDLSIAAGKELASIQAHGSSRFEDVSEQIDRIKTQTAEYSAVSHSYSGLNFLGGFSFHEENKSPVWQSFGAASFSVPEWQIIKDGKLSLLTITLDVSGLKTADHINSRVRQRLQEISKIFSLETQDILEDSVDKFSGTAHSHYQSPYAYDRWIKSVTKAKQYITEGLFEKIVLAREFEIDTERKLAPTHIIHDLRRQYPNCYSFLIGRQGQETFIGCSPERLAAFRKQFLLTEALAGSIQRGTTATEDAVYARQLLNSKKDISEHNFVIKAIEQRLQPFASKVDRDTNPSIKKITNVQHLHTPITARLKDGVNRFAVLKELHPTPAVGGYPWQEASDYIPELEFFDRGWYAGLVGWMNGKRDGEFTVAIRSGLIQDSVARFFAGCGIVADSNPDAEWRETGIKLIPMLSALRYD